MRRALSMLKPARKLMFLAAGVLLAVGLLQRPRTLLGLLTPKGMAAMTVRVFVGFLLACLVWTLVQQSAWKIRRSIGARSRNLVSLLLMVALLALMYTVLGSRAFGGLRLSDLVMHRAFLTQILAFAVMWLALLR
jgi:hypothetical protein